MPVGGKYGAAWKSANPHGDSWLCPRKPDEPNEDSTEVTLTGDGDQTVLVVEQRGLPLDLLWAYGAGLQIHVEDLAAHKASRELADTKTRFDELKPAYRDLATNNSYPGR